MNKRGTFFLAFFKTDSVALESVSTLLALFLEYLNSAVLYFLKRSNFSWSKFSFFLEQQDVRKKVCHTLSGLQHKNHCLLGFD